MKFLNKAKLFINNIKSTIISRIKTFFYFDFSKRNLIEIIFPLSIITLLLASYYYPDFEPRNLVIFLFLFWAILSLLGFFIPMAKEVFMLVFPGPKKPGIPILLQAKSRGGLIAGRKIKLLAKIIDIEKGRSSKQEFRDFYDEFSFAYFGSVRIPITKGKYLEGTPEAGGVNIDVEKCKGKATILFNSPGKYKLRFFCKHKNNPMLLSDEIKDQTVAKDIVISPSENYMSLRNYAITYSLTLIILLLTLLQTKII